MDGIANHFPAKIALDCSLAGFCIFRFKSFPGGDNSGPRRSVDPDTDFR